MSKLLDNILSKLGTSPTASLRVLLILSPLNAANSNSIIDDEAVSSLNIIFIRRTPKSAGRITHPLDLIVRREAFT
jgi:hypothetical protein